MNLAGALGPRDTWQRLAIAVLGVPAIVLGILAMHILVDAQGAHGATHSSAQMEHAAAPAPEDALGCVGPCEPTHGALAMACVLALLVGTLLLAGHRYRVSWLGSTPVVTLASHTGAPAPPRPPSLHALSISRR